MNHTKKKKTKKKKNARKDVYYQNLAKRPGVDVWEKVSQSTRYIFSTPSNRRGDINKFRMDVLEKYTIKRKMIMDCLSMDRIDNNIVQALNRISNLHSTQRNLCSLKIISTRNLMYHFEDLLSKFAELHAKFDASVFFEFVRHRKNRSAIPL